MLLFHKGESPGRNPIRLLITPTSITELKDIYHIKLASSSFISPVMKGKAEIYSRMALRWARRFHNSLSLLFVDGLVGWLVFQQIEKKNWNTKKVISSTYNTTNSKKIK